MNIESSKLFIDLINFKNVISMTYIFIKIIKISNKKQLYSDTYLKLNK